MADDIKFWDDVALTERIQNPKLDLKALIAPTKEFIIQTIQAQFLDGMDTQSKKDARPNGVTFLVCAKTTLEEINAAIEHSI